MVLCFSVDFGGPLFQCYVLNFLVFQWFFVVFHVTDQHGNKLPEDDVAERIQQVDLQTNLFQFDLM